MNMNRKVLICTILFFYALSLSGEKGAVVTWALLLNSTDTTFASGVANTQEGGFIVSGKVRSGGDTPGDGILLKLQPDGDIEWKKRLGPTFLQTVFQTQDTGYAGIVANAGLVKITSSGKLQWYKVLGGLAATGVKDVTSVTETNDGGFLVGSFPGNLTRLDQSGNVIWNKLYLRKDCPDRFDADPSAIQATRDGGFVIAGDYTACTGHPTDPFLTKVDSLGNVQWSWIYSGKKRAFQNLLCLSETKDQGFILLSGNLILKVDSDGTLEFSKAYQSLLGAISIQQIRNGGFAILGQLGTLTRLDSLGNFRWQKIYEVQNGAISLTSFVQAKDGGFVLVGNSLPIQSSDLFAFKVTGSGTTTSSCVHVTRGSDLVLVPILLKQRARNLTVQNTTVTSRSATTTTSNFVAKKANCDP